MDLHKCDHLDWSSGCHSISIYGGSMYQNEASFYVNRVGRDCVPFMPGHQALCHTSTRVFDACHRFVTLSPIENTSQIFP